jgi:hypothetical protein
LIVAVVEPERRGGNDLNVELREVELGEAADAFEPLSYDKRSVFSGIEQHTTRLGDGEVT